MATGNLEARKTQTSARTQRNLWAIKEFCVSVDKFFEEYYLTNMENKIVNKRDDVELVVGMVEWSQGAT